MVKEEDQAQEVTDQTTASPFLAFITVETCNRVSLRHFRIKLVKVVVLN